jgi:hypothetical protein
MSKQTWGFRKHAMGSRGPILSLPEDEKQELEDTLENIDGELGNYDRTKSSRTRQEAHESDDDEEEIPLRPMQDLKGLDAFETSSRYGDPENENTRTAADFFTDTNCPSVPTGFQFNANRLELACTAVYKRTASPSYEPHSIRTFRSVHVPMWPANAFPFIQYDYDD